MRKLASRKEEEDVTCIPDAATNTANTRKWTMTTVPTSTSFSSRLKSPRSGGAAADAGRRSEERWPRPAKSLQAGVFMPPHSAFRGYWAMLHCKKLSLLKPTSVVGEYRCRLYFSVGKGLLIRDISWSGKEILSAA